MRDGRTNGKRGDYGGEELVTPVLSDVEANRRDGERD